MTNEKVAPALAWSHWRRPLVAGVVSLAVYLAIVIVWESWLVHRTGLLSIFSDCLSVPGYAASLLAPRFATYAQWALFKHTVSSLYWFLGGAVSAGLLRRNWQALFAWVGLFLATTVLGFISIAVTIANSEP